MVEQAFPPASFSSKALFSLPGFVVPATRVRIGFDPSGSNTLDNIWTNDHVGYDVWSVKKQFAQ
jgi:hypothetical protein